MIDNYFIGNFCSPHDSPNDGS